MKCKFCETENEDGSVFCNQCGKRIDGKTVCPECGTAFIGKYCPECGAATYAKPQKFYKGAQPSYAEAGTTYTGTEDYTILAMLALNECYDISFPESIYPTTTNDTPDKAFGPAVIVLVFSVLSLGVSIADSVLARKFENK